MPGHGPAGPFGEGGPPAPAAGAGRVLGERGAGTGREPFLGAEGLATCLLSVLVALGSCGLTLVLALGHVLRTAKRASAAPDGPARWIVVLGARLRDGRPGPAFRARLERARCLAEARPAMPVVVLGGATGGGAVAEGMAGTRHLAEAGIPSGRLFAEVGSRHTLENLRAFRAAFPEGDGPPGARAMLLVTSRSHLARACAMARGLGLEVLPCAAEADARRLPARELRRLPAEAFLLHWYAVGSAYARLTRNGAMLRRIG